MKLSTYTKACCAIALMLAMTLVGCSGSAADTNTGSDEKTEYSSAQDTTGSVSTDDMTAEDTSIDKSSSTGSGSQTQLASPFVECTSVLEAAELTGFSMNGPENINGYSFLTILAYTDPSSPIIDMRYQKGEDTISLRKAPASLSEDDISGDYNDYPETTTITNDTAGTITASAYGSDGLVYKMTWKRDAYVFSMSSTAGIETEVASTLLNKVY